MYSSQQSSEPLWIRDRLGPVLLAGLSFLSGGVPQAFAWADFLFPFTAALALLGLAWEIRPSVPFALSATVLICTFSWTDLRKLEQVFNGSTDLTSNLARTPYPQLSLTLFALLLLVLFRLLNRPNQTGLMVGALLTLNFYTYFYSWSYACCWIVVVFLLVLRDYVSSSPARNPMLLQKIRALAVAVVAAIVLAFPVWWGIIHQTRAAVDSFFRLNGQLTHRPSFLYGALLVTAAVVLFKTDEWRGRRFHLCFVLASLLVLNQQVLTGKSLQAGHWTAYFIQPLAMLVLLDCVWRFIEQLPPQPIRNAVFVFVVVGVLFNSTKGILMARRSLDYNRISPEFSELVRELNRYEYRKCAYLTNDPYLTELLPGYTALKPLEPWYMDPLSDENLTDMRSAVAVAYPWSASAGYSSSRKLTALRVIRQQVLVVLNHHREASDVSRNGQIQVLNNADFDVFAPIGGCRSR